MPINVHVYVTLVNATRGPSPVRRMMLYAYASVFGITNDERELNYCNIAAIVCGKF